MAKLKITLVKSLIGRPPKQCATVRALGLRRPGSSIVREDNPQTRGMIEKVSHLLKVEEF